MNGRKTTSLTVVLLMFTFAEQSAKSDELFVPVTNRAGLAAAVAAANDGDTLLLEGGIWDLSDPGIVQIFADDLTIKSADPGNPAHLIGTGFGGFFDNALFVADTRVETGPSLEDLEIEAFLTVLDVDPRFFTDSVSRSFTFNPASNEGASVIGLTISNCRTGIFASGVVRDMAVDRNTFVAVNTPIFIFGTDNTRNGNIFVRNNTLIGPGAFGIAAINGEAFEISYNSVTDFVFGMIIGESRGFSADDHPPHGGNGVIDKHDTLGANPFWGRVHHNDIGDSTFRGIAIEAARPTFEGPAPGTRKPVVDIGFALIDNNVISNSPIGIGANFGTNGFAFVQNDISGSDIADLKFDGENPDSNCPDVDRNPFNGDPTFDNQAIVTVETSVCDFGDNNLIVVGANDDNDVKDLFEDWFEKLIDNLDLQFEDLFDTD